MVTLILMASRRGAEQDLSNQNLSVIENEFVDKAIIFSYLPEDNSSKLEIEFKELNINSIVVKLNPLTTDGLEHSDELRTLSWRISKQMIHEFKNLEDPIVFLGRGSSLHDHLLWIISSSVHSKQYHWDGTELDSYYYDEQYLSSSVAPLVLNGLLELSGKTGLNEFSAEDIAELDDIAEMSGIQSATKPCIERKLLDVSRSKDRSPTYKLTNLGFPVALNYWNEKRLELDRFINKRLLISFGRFAGENSRLTLPNIISKITPHDSYFFLFQKYASGIETSGIFTFDEILVNQGLQSIHEEINNCKLLLQQKQQLEQIGMVEPLIILNPNSSKEFNLDLNLKIFNSIRKFEFSNEEHIFTFDITSCMGSIRSFISKLAVASNSKICYVLKSSEGVSSTGLNVQESPFSRSDHVLDLPSNVAIEAINSMPESRLNILVVMEFFEKGEFNKSSSNDDIEDMLLQKDIIDNKKGLTWNEIFTFVDELNSIKACNIRVDDNRNRLKSLISQQLISRINSVENKFVLTELGEWVASWQINKLGLEWSH